MIDDKNGKHVPVRMCVICRQRFPKALLSRHAMPPRTGEDARGDETRPVLTPDPAMRLPGRGVYVCAQGTCREKFATHAGRRKKRKGVQGDS